ncbi:MAG: DUF115 domain-containing protein [Desulfurellales bacterium]|nr:MAG: DUF115 domain-containing protein [Desulfurellales bacterium]
MSVELKQVKFVHGLNAHVSSFIENIRTNCARYDVPQFKTRRAMLVAGGPSANDHIDAIKAAARDMEVWCVNGAHDWLRAKCGVRPSVCVVMDASPVVDKFIALPLLGVRYMVASQTHPSLVDRLIRHGADVTLWHAALNDEAHAIMGTCATITAPANTVGLHALELMTLSGVRHVTIYGMDSSHRPNADHAYDNSHQRPVDELEFHYKGSVYMATGTWAAQADMFRRLYPMFIRAGLRIEVVGDGLLPAMWADAKSELANEITKGRVAA